MISLKVAEEETELDKIDKLLQAVFLLGLEDFINGDKFSKGAYLHKNAETWLFSLETWHPFAFLRICERFGYDSGSIRSKAIKKRVVMKKALKKNGGRNVVKK